MGIHSLPVKFFNKKSRIRETKYLSTDADSSTDAIGGWTKKTPKPVFFKAEKSSKTQKIKTVQKYAKISDLPFDQRSLIHREAWFLGGPRVPQNPIFLKNGKKPSKTQKLKNVQRYAKISDTPFDQRSLIHLEVWFPPCFVRQNQRQFQITSKQKCLNVRPLLSFTFPQGFRISKNI